MWKGLPWLLLATFVACGAQAHDPSHHPALAGWADEQDVMPEARPRFCENLAAGNRCSCCNGAEIVRGKFRLSVENGPDGFPYEQWDWLNPNTNRWQPVPDDIIHWDEPTPDKQAVAFEYPIGSGVLRCFFPPQETGG